MIRLSAVVNTSCLGPRASTTLGSFGQPHSRRVEFMRDAILPRLRATFDQVIIAGEYESGPSHEYVESPSRFFNCRDVLSQRHAGFLAARHDVILFQMDDHVVDEQFAEILRRQYRDEDVLSPARLSLRTGGVLNSGWNHDAEARRGLQYFHTHAIVMTRHAVERCPWRGLPPMYRFDVAHTLWFEDERLRMRIAPELRVFDLEE